MKKFMIAAMTVLMIDTTAVGGTVSAKNHYTVDDLKKFAGFSSRQGYS